MLDQVERLVWWMGGLTALVALMAIFVGVGRGLRRTPGRVAGRMPGVMHNPLFFVLSSIVYIGLGYLAWQPLPLSFSPAGRLWALVAGGILTLGGLGLVMWGRLALGEMYFVSFSGGAQLFAGHRLVTWGPFALVRHPMYLGILMTGLGGILLYRTWTMMLILLTGLGVLLRARREDQALAAEFGQSWRDYAQHTPAIIPWFHVRARHSGITSSPVPETGAAGGKERSPAPRQGFYHFFAPLYDILFGATYASARRRTVHLLQLRPRERLLMPGIGTGLDLPLIPAGVQVTGVDIAREMLRLAEKKTSRATVTLIQMDAQQLALPPESFDAALLNLIVSVAPDGKAIFQQAWRALKPGGRLVLFDKFLPEDQSVNLPRKILGGLFRLLGTDINRRLSDILGNVPNMSIELNEPSLFFGRYRILKIRKAAAEAGQQEDDLLYSSLKPISWERTETLGRGDPRCNFVFRSRSAQVEPAERAFG